jgi:hypothetical protein
LEILSRGFDGEPKRKVASANESHKIIGKGDTDANDEDK